MNGNNRGFLDRAFFMVAGGIGKLFYLVVSGIGKFLLWMIGIILILFLVVGCVVLFLALTGQLGYVPEVVHPFIPPGLNLKHI